MNNEEQILDAFQILHDELMKYRRNRFKVWVFLLLGLVIGSILSPVTVLVAKKLGLSLYDRSGLDGGLF